MADDDALAPVYLIGGDDRDKVRRALDRLRARYAGDAVEEVDATADEPETAVARCRQQGLFATERLVVVDHLEAWVRPKRAGRLDPLLDYLAEPDPSAVLVLVEDAPADPKKPLLAPDDPMVRAIVKVSGKQGVLRFQAAKGAAFARTEAERLGVALDPESLRLFGDLMGDRPAEISRELDKLSTWAMGTPSRSPPSACSWRAVVMMRPGVSWMRSRSGIADAPSRNSSVCSKAAPSRTVFCRR